MVEAPCSRHGAYRIGQRPPDATAPTPGAAHADRARRHRLGRREHARSRRPQPGRLRGRRADRADATSRRWPSWPAGTRAQPRGRRRSARYAELKAALAGSGIGVAAGPAALIEAAAEPADCVMAASSARPASRRRSRPRGRGGASRSPTRNAWSRPARSSWRRWPSRDRADAGRLRAFGGVPGAGGAATRKHRAHRAHRLGRPVPHLEPRAAAQATPAAGAAPSQLVHGRARSPSTPPP